ncbi:MAG: hypothetical protein ACR2FY_00535 [Pirellulaceae bacterium]
MLEHEQIEMQPDITNMNRHQLLRLTLLIAANCLLLGLASSLGFLWMSLKGSPWINSLSNVCEGVLTAQFLLIGFWCALAPERLVWRLLTGIVLAGLLLGINFPFVGMVNPTYAFDFAADQSGKYCGLALITFLVLRALRPWFGWRLAWKGTPPLPRSRQFRIIDLLAWTTAVAVPLGLLQTLYGGQAPQLALLTVVTFVVYLPITIPAFRWAIHPARKSRWLIALLLWGPLWPACGILAINGGYLFFGNTGLPSWRGSLMQLAIWSAFYLPLVVVWVSNVLALRKIGLRAAAKSPQAHAQSAPPPANFAAP